MNVIILNTNSFGGNYEYSKCLAEAYKKNAFITSCVVLIPQNAAQPETGTYKKILLSDLPDTSSRLLKKLYFIYRSLINPFKILAFLKKSPGSFVIFNDFDQLTAPLWSPFFFLLKKKHTFGVILHDADRDNYLPIKILSEYTMARVMSIMDIALYHEILPIKSYYSSDIRKIDVPHGIYFYESFSTELYELLLKKKGNKKLMGMLGNIRDEKNYVEVIESLPTLPDVMLCIAGSPSGSKVNTDVYKELAAKLHVEDRIIWVEKRLSDEELQAAIKACDLILLYYKESFVSQSGILNLIAPHKKNVLISNSPSGLRHTVETFGIGEICPLNKVEFIKSVKNIFEKKNASYEMNWENYMTYASWDNHVQTMVTEIHSLINK